MACASPELCKEICGSEAGCTNMAFVKLVTELMPVGLRYSITCCTNMAFVKLVTELKPVGLRYSITCCTNMTFVKLVTELMPVGLRYYMLHEHGLRQAGHGA